MTIKELREAIAHLPDDGEVYVERIEDVYFEDHGWSVKRMKGEMYHHALRFNEWVRKGKVKGKLQTPEEIDEFQDQYMDIFCAINFDGKNLYLTSHY